MRGVTGLVLAGGRSSRMGLNKAYLEYQGQPLYLHMQQVLKQANCQQVLLSGKQLGGLADPAAVSGPLAGLSAALAELSDAKPTQALVVVPVDMPLLTAEIIHTLCSQAEAQGAQAACFERWFMPLYLRLDAKTHQAVQQTISAPERRDRSLKNLLRRLDYQSYESPVKPSMFANANTPAQWQQLLQGVSHGT